MNELLPPAAERLCVEGSGRKKAADWRARLMQRETIPAATKRLAASRLSPTSMRFHSELSHFYSEIS